MVRQPLRTRQDVGFERENPVLANNLIQIETIELNAGYANVFRC